ncbi:sulfotransferase 1C2A-like [Mercenaria mercenaria]|uniref:sulfotransferase 1C2A-like n=1 Tax=Mercenaria mercenaria TaxID=6596 RepID=UPI00234E380A|nr:sulfotransferase 1C2A-like [Mercenaria mercenaria]XP_045202036.2 sulfotransferase 1C2A-like [Mercenaria mercenaria]
MLFEDDNDYKIIEVNGLAFPIPFFKTEEEILQRFLYVKNFPYKAGDVLLCSCPKTGTHWLTNLLHYLMYDGQLDDMLSYQPYLVDFHDIEEEVQRNGRRIISSHFPPKHLPVEHFAKGGKTILLFRNPKDTAVSMFHMLRKQKIYVNFKLSWDTYLKYWLEGKIPMGSYFEYYNSWQKELNKRPDLDILIVQYEDLKRDSLHELRRIKKYLGLHHSDERLKAVLNKCSLENLKADVDSGEVKTRLTDEKGISILFRKGIIGDWKNHFTVAQNQEFEAIVNEKLKNSIFNYKLWN